MENEEWRIIPGSETYQVSSLGRVRSLPRRILTRSGYRNYKGVLIKPGHNNPGGHEKLFVHFDGEPKRRAVYVHDMVLLAFVGPKPPGHEGAHGDGLPQNNRLPNLRYATPKENAADKIVHGTHLSGEGHPRAKLTFLDVATIKAHLGSGEKHKSLAETFGVSRQAISAINQGRSWK